MEHTHKYREPLSQSLSKHGGMASTFLSERALCGLFRICSLGYGTIFLKEIVIEALVEEPGRELKRTGLQYEGEGDLKFSHADIVNGKEPGFSIRRPGSVAFHERSIVIVITRTIAQKCRNVQLIGTWLIPKRTQVRRTILRRFARWRWFAAWRR